MPDPHTNTWVGPALTAMGSFATAIVGFVAMRFLEAKKDERAYQREKSAREDARRDKIIERRNEHQRQTLVELQAVAQRALRASGRVHHHDEMALRDGTPWGKSKLPEDVNQDSFDYGVKLTALLVQVRDTKVREIGASLKGSLTANSLARSKEDADRTLRTASEAFDAMNRRITEVFESLDEVTLFS